MYANNGDTDQMPHPVASDLGLLCLLMSRKKNTRLICLIWFNVKCIRGFSRTPD